jgi:hypothetical protein
LVFQSGSAAARQSVEERGRGAEARPGGFAARARAFFAPRATAGLAIRATTDADICVGGSIAAGTWQDSELSSFYPIGQNAIDEVDRNARSRERE